MVKITFMGAGSTVFAKNVLGDCMLTEVLNGLDIALYDIDNDRLKESEVIIKAINKKYGANANIKTYHGIENRKEALRGADFVVNAIQVGGYDPSTIIDFEIPKKFGLRQTIADTLGIGGIFRALRTIPVMLDFAADMAQVCPNALFLNYTNPMAMVTGAVQKATDIKTVGLCHSVQGCAESLLHSVGMGDMYSSEIKQHIAGINHQAWLLKIEKDGVDLYPEIKRRSLMSEYSMNERVRLKIMNTFGYFITESSEHLSEYLPYFIKPTHPELIEEFAIPLDEYPRRCIRQIEEWQTTKEELSKVDTLEHNRSSEYASHIVEAVVTGTPYKIGGSVLNTGIITNLPTEACVEVPCMVDGNGVTPLFVGDLPPQLAALNRTNINPQLLAIDAALNHKKESIYHAALLDPHTSAQLSIDETIALCDELIEAHADYLPEYK